MTWAWLALCSERPAGAIAVAGASGSDGSAAGYLAAWAPDAPHPASAARVDGRAIDPHGHPGWASLVVAPPGLFLPFDDRAVTAALRRVLSMVAPRVFSTLLVGDDRLVGALTAENDPGGRLGQDPFALLFPVVLGVEPGILGSMPAPAGPTTQRYGANNPWPWDRFSNGVDQ